jgi:hypothetical protein
VHPTSPKLVSQLYPSKQSYHEADKYSTSQLCTTTRTFDFQALHDSRSSIINLSILSLAVGVASEALLRQHSSSGSWTPSIFIQGMCNLSIAPRKARNWFLPPAIICRVVDSSLGEPSHPAVCFKCCRPSDPLIQRGSSIPPSMTKTCPTSARHLSSCFRRFVFELVC